MSKVSDCCGASADDGDGYELDICPACGEHCEYIDEDDEVCETCDGEGEIRHGHYADPNAWTERCPDCDKHDPDTRDR